MTVTFGEISPNTKTPIFHVEVNPQGGVSSTEQPTLLIMPGIEQGAKYDAANSGVIFPVFSAEQASAECGQGSPAHLAAESYLANDALGPVFVSLLENAGTQALGLYNVIGTATADGSSMLYIGTESLFFSISSGDAAFDIAETIKDTINGEAASLTSGNPVIGQLYEITAQSIVDFTTIGAPGVAPGTVGDVFVATGSGVTLSAVDSLKPINTDLPVYATHSTGSSTVALTAKAAGEQDNGTFVGVNIQGEELPAGVISITPGAMTGGVNGAAVSDAIAEMNDDLYDFILSYSNSLTDKADIVDELNRRWTDLAQIYGHSWSCFEGTFSQIISKAAEFNTEQATTIGIDSIRGTEYQFGAAYMAKCAVSLKADPALPCQTLEMNRAFGSRGNSVFSTTERESFLNNGVATFTQTKSGSQVFVERSITNYVTDAFGATDRTWLDIQTKFTAMLMIRELRSMVQSKFSQYKLADNGTPISPGSRIVTPDTFKGEIIALYTDWVDRGLAENIEAFKAQLVVVRDSNDVNRLNIFFPPDFVNQLRVVAVNFAFKV